MLLHLFHGTECIDPYISESAHAGTVIVIFGFFLSKSIQIRT